MTKHREFKALVRERMTKTGERYAAARTHILRERAAEPVLPKPVYSGLLARYPVFGGLQEGTAPVTNVLASQGLSWAATGRPFTEAVVNGLCGGPGFLYAVFEYKGWPPMLSIALQARSMPDAYIALGLSRLGVRGTTKETGSEVAARKLVDGLLDAGRPALMGLGLRTVAVVGREGGDYWLDGRSPVPTRMSASDLWRARGAKSAKRRITTIDGAVPGHDPLGVLREALADTAKGYSDPPVPKAFHSNCGFAGLEKWARLLVDAKDAKGWPAVFPEGPKAAGGLIRAYSWIACFAGAGAGRPLYADFLTEASRVLNTPGLAEAGAAFMAAGEAWTRLATTLADVDDAAVREGCEAADTRLAALDLEGDCSATDDPMALIESYRAMTAGSRLTKATARSIYSEMSDRLQSILLTERAAVEALRSAVSPSSTAKSGKGRVS